MLETRLAEWRFIAGDAYSIADVASYPWVEAARVAMQEPLGDAFASSPAIADGWRAWASVPP